MPRRAEASDHFAPTEASFRKQITATAVALGWAFYHPPLSRGHGGWTERGWPDIALVKPPRVILAEVKLEKGKLSPAQIQWIDLLGGCPGVEVYVWRPRDIDGIARLLGA